MDAEQAVAATATNPVRTVIGEPRRVLMAELPAPKDGFVLTHFIVVEDVERSRRFYSEVLGGEVVMEGEPSIVALANGWVAPTGARRGPSS